MKVAVSYRVLQPWRVPVFERLARIPEIDLRVFYGEDFEGTKLISYKGPVNFAAEQLNTLKLKFSTKHGGAYVPFSPSLFLRLKSFNPDVIIAEGASNFANNIICFLYAKIHKKKIIQWGLGQLAGRHRSLHRVLLDLIFSSVERYSDAAIAYSSFGAKYYIGKGIGLHNVIVAVNVVDTEQRSADLMNFCRDNNLLYPSPLPRVFKVLFVGALAENKGVDVLLRAFSQFTKGVDDPSATLTIVGDGAAREVLQKLAVDLDLTQRVIFAGHVKDGIARYFYDASIFVLPGLGGLAVSDALSHGVPVICGVGDGCEKDLIKEGVNGKIISNLDQATLCRELELLWSNRGYLNDMRIGAQQFLSSGLDVNSYVNKIFEAIKRCES